MPRLARAQKQTVHQYEETRGAEIIMYHFIFVLIIIIYIITININVTVPLINKGVFLSR
jgi:hypothetical protein